MKWMFSLALVLGVTVLAASDAKAFGRRCGGGGLFGGRSGGCQSAPQYGCQPCQPSVVYGCQSQFGQPTFGQPFTAPAPSSGYTPYSYTQPYQPGIVIQPGVVTQPMQGTTILPAGPITRPAPSNTAPPK